MKQGPMSNRYAPKTEPRAHAINPGAAATIGVQELRTVPKPLMAGRGYNAPAPVATTSHKSGSQGKYK